eukprot:Skav229849  [mRNA]  locus=scaffold2033:357256:358266:+ [translate_table: standard]
MWQDDSVVAHIRTQLATEVHKRYVFPPVPRTSFTPRPVFLYVFSGRRRKDDYQTYVEQYLAKHGVEGDILCIDLALSPKHDVTNPELVRTLMSWIQDGCIAAALLAPPCETWSQVRYLQDEHPAPRPVRSRDDPLALDQLTAQELRQVSVANCLLMIAIRLFLACAMQGVPCVCEHPREPSAAHKPSIWRLPWLIHMEAEGILRRHAIQQAYFGSPSSKPTNLAECHCPTFRRVMKEMSFPVNWHELIELKGRRQDGSWYTSAAKEYPPRMNQALALLHVTEFRRIQQQIRAPRPVPEGYHEAFRNLYAGDVNMEEQTMQPDYGHRLWNTALDCME